MAVESPARIAILGAGPIGLEAALYARFLGYEVDVYERGRVAEHLRRWGHVRLFAPFSAISSPLGIAAIAASRFRLEAARRRRPTHGQRIRRALLPAPFAIGPARRRISRAARGGLRRPRRLAQRGTLGRKAGRSRFSPLAAIAGNAARAGRGAVCPGRRRDRRHRHIWPAQFARPRRGARDRRTLRRARTSPMACPTCSAPTESIMLIGIRSWSGRGIRRPGPSWRWPDWGTKRPIRK